MSKRPTVYDVARAAGVSAMTVSRVVNNKPGVGDELRRRIRSLADQIGYRPNQVARSLVTSQSATIGLVVPDISNAFFSQIVCGAEDVAFEHGYTLLLVNTGEALAREEAALDTLWQKDVAGLILCSSRLPREELEAQAGRYDAAVLLNRELGVDLPGVVTVSVNDVLGAQVAVRRLVERGRTRIAVAAGPVTSMSAQRRMDGYRTVLTEAGLWFDPELLEHCAPTIEGGFGATEALFARRPRLDAILAFNDLVAIGAMEACRAKERVVPQDVAVCGFDDIPLAAMVRPPLTTVRVDLPEVGREMMRLLLASIRGETPPRATGIDPSLVIRESA